jgi:predicted transcriptional regulator
MHTYVKALTKIASRYAPSRMLSFELVHIFKVFQLLDKNGHISRTLLCQELGLGEGSVRTLLKHLKMQGLVSSTNGGTRLTEKGKALSSELLQSIPSESNMSICSIALGKFNYVVLLRNYAFAIKSGIEQRDAAIKIGALGATTLLYKDHKFIMPGSHNNKDSLHNEPHIANLLINKLMPEDSDVIIIGSDNKSLRIAEFGAKNAALFTIREHEKHGNFLINT